MLAGSEEAFHAEVDNIGMLSVYTIMPILLYRRGLEMQVCIISSKRYTANGFRPVYQRHFEAVEMEAAGGAKAENALELESELNILLNDEALLKKRGEAAKQYVYSNAGATRTILDYIYRNRLLTS